VRLLEALALVEIDAFVARPDNDQLDVRLAGGRLSAPEDLGSNPTIRFAKYLCE
jgi:hypothetical protein